MKIWVFVEGDSENKAMINIIRRFYGHFLIVLDPIEFVEAESNDTTTIFYIHDCGGIDGVPFAINYNNYLMQQSGVDKALVFCDIERIVDCALRRRELIEALLEDDVDKTKLKYVFSRLSIESIYPTYPDQMARTVEMIHRARKNGRSVDPDIDLNNLIRIYGSDINGLMRAVNLSYRKPEFANEFFARFLNSDDFLRNETLNRLKSFFDSL